MSSVVAIDGPSASGKSTVSREVARRLDWKCVDSGAVYRGVTWQLHSQGVDCHDIPAVVQALPGLEFDFSVVDCAVVFKVNGLDPGNALRAQPVRERVSPVAAVPAVREKVVALLRGLTVFGNLVVEGRDIGTVVFPDALAKFYLDASADERARRRHGDITGQAERTDLSAVSAELERRDALDSTRAVAPLCCARDALVLDTTAMDLAAVVEQVVALVRSKLP